MPEECAALRSMRKEIAMGVYRRKRKDRTLSPYWSIYLPTRINPKTGRVIYTTRKVGVSKREAERLFEQKMAEWRKKVHLGIEDTTDKSFGELAEWYLTLPVAQSKRSYQKDIERGKVLKEHFGGYPARLIKLAMVEEFQRTMLRTRSSRGRAYRPATVNRMVSLMKRI